MNNRISDNFFKAIVYFFLFTALMLASIFTEAQSSSSENKLYKGLYASFGSRSLKFNSNVPQLNKVMAVEGGGQLGAVIGNDIFRSTIGLFGYYSSVSNVAGSIDLYESSASVNFYPLNLISKNRSRVTPYLTGGLSYNNLKFYGFYLGDENKNVNYSVSELPYLGALSLVNGTIGTGVEIQILDDYDFVHLFTEVKYGYNISSQSKNAEFQNTSAKNQMQVSLGISFGTHR